MHDREFISEALPLFKALADKNRLKIIGLIANQPVAVEDLAKALHIGASTASHHLSVLTEAGLVEAKAEGYYNKYYLRTGALEAAAKQILQTAPVKRQAEESAEDEYDRKVLATFTDEEGRITAFPMQQKKFLVLIRYVLKSFEPGVQYSEKHVNVILSRYSKDTARIRRALVDYKFMDREGGGGKYWLR